LRICFSLFDFLWLETLAAEDSESQTAEAAASFPGRNALQFPGGREALLEHVLIPLFREFRGHRALFAWEIVNEPEWAIPEFQRSPGATLPFAEAHAFFAEIARAIHEESGGIPVTLGSARLASCLERNRPGPAAGSLLSATGEGSEPIARGAACGIQGSFRAAVARGTSRPRSCGQELLA